MVFFIPSMFYNYMEYNYLLYCYIMQMRVADSIYECIYKTKRFSGNNGGGSSTAYSDAGLFGLFQWFRQLQATKRVQGRQVQHFRLFQSGCGCLCECRGCYYKNAVY